MPFWKYPEDKTFILGLCQILFPASNSVRPKSFSHSESSPITHVITAPESQTLDLQGSLHDASTSHEIIAEAIIPHVEPRQETAVQFLTPQRG